MARQNHGPLSKAKGKLGAVVYQQYEGMQISKEYQPVVKNPQTTKQINQRAKFKLASQVTAQFADILNVRLTKYSPYTRMRRAAILKNLVRVVIINDGSAELATIDMQNSINAISMPEIEAPTANTSTAGQISITATEGDIVVTTTVGYSESGMFEKKVSETFTSTGSAKTFMNIGSNKSTFMCVALRATTEEGRAVITNALASDNDWANAIIRAEASGDVLVSELLVANILSA